MAILYTNINKDLSLAFRSTYKTYKKADLQGKFEDFLCGEKFLVEWTDRKESPYKCTIENDSEKYTLYMYLKNISGAGWENKPWIKRVQVPNIRIQHPEYYVETNENKTLLVLGYYNYDSNPIMVAWNAYDFVMHTTVRSCYVEVDDLIRGYEEKYYCGECSGERIWVFTPGNFVKFLKEYILFNNLEG